MYLLKSVVAIRGIENGQEAYIIEDYRRLVSRHYEGHSLVEVLIQCKEEIAGELVGDVVLGRCIHGVDLNKTFCEHGCRV